MEKFGQKPQSGHCLKATLHNEFCDMQAFATSDIQRCRNLDKKIPPLAGVRKLLHQNVLIHCSHR